MGLLDVPWVSGGAHSFLSPETVKSVLWQTCFSKNRSCGPSLPPHLTTCPIEDKAAAAKSSEGEQGGDELLLREGYNYSLFSSPVVKANCSLS